MYLPIATSSLVDAGIPVPVGKVSKITGTSLPCQAPESGTVVRAVFGNSPKYRYRHVGKPKPTLAFALLPEGQVKRFRFPAAIIVGVTPVTFVNSAWTANSADSSSLFPMRSGVLLNWPARVRAV